jgi:aminoglycoside phosphotransferase (APT) family kinase protein
LDQHITTLLQEYLSHSPMNQPGLIINEVEHLSTGWESELYRFVLDYETGGRHHAETYLLRIYPGDGAKNKSLREFTAIQRLYQASFPVPEVYLLERETSPFGQPFIIMEWIEGEALWSILSRSSEPEKMALLSRFCELYVQLHRLDWRRFVDNPPQEEPAPYAIIDQWLNNARNSLQNFPQVNFNPLLRWIEGHHQDLACPRPTPAHQDFHPNNVMQRKDGSMVVIDWTNFEITDPRFDLSWTLILALGYEGQAFHDFILNEYERHAGESVSQIEIFEVLAVARRLFDIAVSIDQGAERLGMRAEAVAMMKQQMHAHQRVYEHMLRITGIRLLEIERLFTT